MSVNGEIVRRPAYDSRATYRMLKSIQAAHFDKQLNADVCSRTVSDSRSAPADGAMHSAVVHLDYRPLYGRINGIDTRRRMRRSASADIYA